MNLRAGLWSVAVLLIAAMVLVWNASQLIGAPARPREKDLEFMPSAAVLRVLSAGNTNTVAKLRWIDSFAYLQLQFDKKDDTLIGDKGGSGFERLCDALIDLDPKFEPFYDFAIMSDSILGHEDNSLALRSVQRGLLELPHSRHLWQNLAVLIKTSKGSNSTILDGVLSRWAAMATTDEERYSTERWKSQLGIFDLKGLSQLEYWCEALVNHAQRSPLAEMAASTLQQQLNNYGIARLQELGLADGADRVLDGSVAEVDLLRVYGKNGQLEIPTALVIWGPFAFSPQIAQQLEQAVLAKQKTLIIPAQPLSLRGDPYGFAYRVVDGEIASVGKEQFKYEEYITSCNLSLQEQAKQKGRWPYTISEAWEWLGKQRLAPYFADCSLRDNRIELKWVEQPAQPAWDLRSMAGYWLSLLNGKGPMKK